MIQSQVEKRWIDISGILTMYLTGGEGPPLVLVHGGAGCAEEEWGPNLEALASEFRVYAPDMVGFGETDKRRVDYDFEIFDSFFADFIRSLDIEKASFIGHSLGGEVVLRFTLAYPEKVEKLILVDSAGFTEDLGLIGKLFTPFFILRARMKNDQTYLSMAQNLTKGDVLLLDRLSDISVPTLIVWGDLDVYFPVKLAYTAHSLINYSQLEVFKGCWHAPQRERPEQFNRLVMDFLSQ